MLHLVRKHKSVRMESLTCVLTETLQKKSVPSVQPDFGDAPAVGCAHTACPEEDMSYHNRRVPSHGSWSQFPGKALAGVEFQQSLGGFPAQGISAR